EPCEIEGDARRDEADRQSPADPARPAVVHGKIHGQRSPRKPDFKQTIPPNPLNLTADYTDRGLRCGSAPHMPAILDLRLQPAPRRTIRPTTFPNIQVPLPAQHAIPGGLFREPARVRFLLPPPQTVLLVG